MTLVKCAICGRPLIFTAQKYCPGVFYLCLRHAIQQELAL